MQENNHFGLLCTKQKHRNTEKPNNKTTKTKNMTKKHLLHSGKPPLFLLNFLAKLHSLMSAKLCFAENTIKIVFSAEHSF